MTTSRLTTLLSVPIGLGVAFFVYQHVTPYREIQCNYLRATPGHEDGFPMSIANPRKTPTNQDSYSLRIPAWRLRPGLSDEEILARFTKGFFGRWIFTPERWLFLSTKLSITRQLTMPQEETSSSTRGRTTVISASTPEIWHLSSLSASVVPPLGSLLFGNFILLDSSAASVEERDAMFPCSNPGSRPDCVFAEFTAGSASIEFISSHRFEITREKTAEEGEMVKITFSHVNCNPTGNASRIRSWMKSLHVLYSKLLFSDGVREVLAN
ncbi:hypothetical protein GQ53DRAFT_843162 [Thozetella sp. PMI_491]|nr:hypothetical protein GQ53DRAFT_843162 [Thozetella sp. PMI_491]